MPRAGSFSARLALLSLAAFALRLLYVLVLGDPDGTPARGGDRFFFVRGAELLAEGHGFVHPFVFDAGNHDAASAGHPPLWIAALAPLGKLGLLGHEAARIAGGLAGAAVVAVVGLIARRMAGPRAGLVAATIAAVYPAWLVADVSGMSEALYLLLAAGAMLALLRARDTGSRRSAVLLGALIGLASLTRTEGLFLLPLVALPLLWRRWSLLAVVALSAALVVIPWTVRNAIVLDRFVPVSTNVDTVLAGANCDETYYGPDAGRWSARCFASATVLRGGLAGYDEGALADRWRSAGLDYAGEHLGRLPIVAALRVARSWRVWQPLREPESTEGQGRTASKIGALSFLLLLLPAGLLGAWRGGLRREHLLLFAGLALMVSATSALGWGAPRFLRPAELGLIVCAAAYVALRRGESSGARPSRPT